MIRGWRALERKNYDGLITCRSEDVVSEFDLWGALHGRQTIYDKVVVAELAYLTITFSTCTCTATGVGYILFVGVASEAQVKTTPWAGRTSEKREAARGRLKRQRLGMWWAQGRDARSAFNEAQADAEPSQKVTGIGDVASANWVIIAKEAEGAQ